MTEPIIGAKRYHYFEKETGTGAAWGTRPTTPVLVHAPVTSYGVKLVRNTFERTPFVGTGQQLHAQSNNSIVQGTIAMPLYGAFDSGAGVSLAEYFLSLGIDTTNQELYASRPSMRAWDIQRDGDDTLVAGHEDSGLRVNKMTLKGSSQGGLELSLDLIGKNQITIAAAEDAIPNDRNSLTEFLFSDTVLTIGGSAVLFDEFTYEVDWGLKPLYLNSTRPSKLNAQHARHTLSFKPLKESATYDAYLRLTPQTELASVLTIKGLHSGTSTNNYAQCVFTFARAALLSAEDAISYDDFGYQPIVLKCLKPDTSANTVVPVWSTVA